MNLRYLRYMECFCSSGQFSAYNLLKGRLAAVEQNDRPDLVVNSGLVRCDKCGRCFPVENGIMDALPDALSEFKCTETLKAGCMKQGIECRREESCKGNPDNASNAKRSEITARDEQAEVYHTYGYPLFGRNEQKLIRNFLKFTKNDVVVELGSGTGRISQEIIENGFCDYVSIDFSAQSIQLFKQKLDKKTRERVFFLVGDVCALPLKSGIADKIVSAQVFEHVPGREEQRRFLGELQRLLKSDGLAAMTVYNYNLKKRLDKKISRQGFHSGRIYYENFTYREMKSLISPFFNLRVLKGINCDYPFTRRLMPRTQEFMESVLAATPLGSYLGDILFIGLSLRARDPRIVQRTGQLQK